MLIPSSLYTYLYINFSDVVPIEFYQRTSSLNETVPANISEFLRNSFQNLLGHVYFGSVSVTRRLGNEKWSLAELKL